MSILITGATGFIGHHLQATLANDGVTVRLLCRQAVGNMESCVTGDLLDPPSLLTACKGVETVFHCAGYAHAFEACNQSEVDLHWRVNFEGSRNLFLAAALCGVKRFVFLSSVKAMPEPGEMCADENLDGEPNSDYGRSKRAAEQFLLAHADQYGMHVCILRLSMVYGPGSRGNLERMMRLVRRGVFPPLPETCNHRSMVHVRDVVSAITLVAREPVANGKIYIVSGDEAPSGADLFNMMRIAAGLWPVKYSIPLFVLKLGAACGDWIQSRLHRPMPLNREVLNRLLGSAWYSAEKIRRELGWWPVVSLQEGLNELASHG